MMASSTIKRFTIDTPRIMEDTWTSKEVIDNLPQKQLFIWNKYGNKTYSPEAINRQWVYLAWSAGTIYSLFLAFNGWDMYFYDYSANVWHKITNTQV